jgi:hypothetical protein
MDSLSEEDLSGGTGAEKSIAGRRDYFRRSVKLLKGIDKFFNRNKTLI